MKCIINGREIDPKGLQESNPGIPTHDPDLLPFLREWFSDSTHMEAFTSGSTGTPKTIRLGKEQMRASARLTINTFNLRPGQTALLCLPVKFIAGKMMVVRAIEGEMDLVTTMPNATPLANLEQPVDFAAMTPLQVSNSLHKLEFIKTLIVGGGEMSEPLKVECSTLKVDVFETYGMTETITHVAVRRVGEIHFRALKGVRFSQDDHTCLVINADHLDIPITTKDIVELYSETTFNWLGRYDNVINTGGIKVLPEQVERKLQKAGVNALIYGMPDDRLGQRVVAVVEGRPTNSEAFESLGKYEKPKAVYYVDAFVLTENGKPDRAGTIRLIRD